MMMKNIFFAALFTSSICVNAQITKVSPLFKGALHQYQKSEWEITLSGQWSNPYDASQIALDMLYVTPDGARESLPCYYEKGASLKTSCWKARFAPRSSGEYKIWFVLTSGGEKYVSHGKKYMCQPTGMKGFLHTSDNPWTLRYDNGEAFRGIGENIGWESRDVDDSKYFKKLHEDVRFNYDYMLHKLAASGGNFFRTWMIYWNLPVDWKAVKNNRRYQSTKWFYNESAMRRMDHLVELCDSLGPHIMLTLESHVGLMGEGWDMSSYNIRNGGYADTPRQFFENPQSRRQYKNKLRLMIARYGYSPSIAVWEFFNEVDHVMYDKSYGAQIPAETIADWHREMSEYLKAHDPYRHIVSTSISHRDIDPMNRIPTLDINQRHIYGNAYTIPGTIRSYGQKYGKPYVIGECGYHWDWSLDFNQYSTEFDRDFRRALWLGLFSPTPILPMSWWWEFFENRGMMSYYSIVRRINDDMLHSAQGRAYESVAVASVDSVESYGVRCGSKVYIYLYNAASRLRQLDVVTASRIADGKYRMDKFDTMTGAQGTADASTDVRDGRISLPNITLHPYEQTILILQ